MELRAARKPLQIALVAGIGLWALIGSAQAGWIDRRFPENGCRWQAATLSKTLTCQDRSDKPLVTPRKTSDAGSAQFVRVASLPPVSSVDTVVRRPSLAATRK